MCFNKRIARLFIQKKKGSKIIQLRLQKKNKLCNKFVGKIDEGQPLCQSNQFYIFSPCYILGLVPASHVASNACSLMWFGSIVYVWLAWRL